MRSWSRAKKHGFTVAKRLVEICRRTDPTRPSTIGFNYYPAPFVNNMAAQIDVVGLNYKPAIYKEAKRTISRYPALWS